jgi:hypothetical protein
MPLNSVEGLACPGEVVARMYHVDIVMVCPSRFCTLQRAEPVLCICNANHWSWTRRSVHTRWTYGLMANSSACIMYLKMLAEVFVTRSQAK